MSQTAITLAFEQWKASQAVTGEPVLLDEFVFANVPGLDTSKPIDRNETLPPDAQIVHRQAVNRKGVVNENAVVHSAVLGADVGDFSFNWIGLINKASNTLAMIVHAPVQQKLKTKDGQQGNVLTRSFLMEFNGAQSETGINTPAETWQIDFTARMAGMDERQRLENIDLYGVAAFFGDGYLVGKNGAQYFVTPGVGYVRGLRSQLAAVQNITVTTKPVKVWLDVAWTGTLTSAWTVESKITVADALADYVQGGVQHYVFAVASIDANGNVTDLRPKGTLDDQAASDALKKHEQSRNHPDATTAAKGFTQLSSATNSDSEALAATPKAVKAAYDLANGKYTAQDATTTQKGIVQLSSATDSTSETLAATPKAVKMANDNAKSANDNANGRVPLTRRVNGRELSQDIDITSQDIFNGQAVVIGNAVDMNSITTPGLYFQASNAQAQTGRNYPEAVAGSLEVYKHAGVTQVYRIYADSRSYIRTFYNGAWSIWVKQYDAANKPAPGDIGAVSEAGGNYNATFRFGSVGTVPTEKNMASLVSAQGGAGSIVSGAVFQWYDNSMAIGLTRGASYDATGFAIWLNNKNLFNIDYAGNVGVTGNIVTKSIYADYVQTSGDLRSERNISSKGIIEAGGGVFDTPGVRVYSPNNQPPQPDLSPYATTAWVNGNFATSSWTVANFLQGGIRLASPGTADNGNNDGNYAYAPNGAVVTAVMQKTNYTAVQYRYVQYNIGGNWYTAWVA
ncbi:phage tail protein [Enterobacter cloacae subsp. cloacae]|uniref:tail fiber protein n=2 Tax=Enterobacter cloacae TaxID=550 RepID=UPI001FF3953F|nr:tail fiber protein [Enterobacter cloacae]MCK1070668.1 phage tail protein [Enterobacter cloacae subsp. cloacae]